MEATWLSDKDLPVNTGTHGNVDRSWVRIPGGGNGIPLRVLRKFPLRGLLDGFWSS